MPPKSKGAGDKNLKSKSPAEFFQDNKGIAGFENAGKSLYTTLREFIENSLDSAEGIGVLPDVDISVEEVTLSQYEDLIGLKTHVRKDSALYADIETDKEKQKRLKDEAKAAAKAAKGGKADAGGGGKRGGAKAFFRVTVKDNGCGMSHSSIPNMLGIVLSGSKYGVRQTRGKFGLGAKMALIWGKKSTGIPVTVVTSHTKNPGEVPAKVRERESMQQQSVIIYDESNKLTPQTTTQTIPGLQVRPRHRHSEE